MSLFILCWFYHSLSICVTACDNNKIKADSDSSMCDSKVRNMEEHNILFDDLIKELEEKHNSWIFRGQSKSEYDLSPSAFRSSGKKELMFLNNAINEGMTELMEIGKGTNNQAEESVNRAMRLFHIMCSRQGLSLPDGSNINSVFINPNGYFLDSIGVDGITNDSYLKLEAIAQHYGFPTTLLDWSFDPLCALYFAVVEALSRLAAEDGSYSLSDGCFSIWALNLDYFKNRIATAAKEDEDDVQELLICTYNYHNNRNIIAQKGLFTYVKRNSIVDKRIVTDIVDKVNDVKEPILVKYNVSYRELLVAMDHLRKNYKTSDVFFPGYEGVVRSMKDYANYINVKGLIEGQFGGKEPSP